MNSTCPCALVVPGLALGEEPPLEGIVSEIATPGIALLYWSEARACKIVELDPSATMLEGDPDFTPKLISVRGPGTKFNVTEPVTAFEVADQL